MKTVINFLFERDTSFFEVIILFGLIINFPIFNSWNNLFINLGVVAIGSAIQVYMDKFLIKAE